MIVSVRLATTTSSILVASCFLRSTSARLHSGAPVLATRIITKTSSYRRASRFQGGGKDVLVTLAPTAIERMSPTSQGRQESEPYPVAETTHHEYRCWPPFGIWSSCSREERSRHED